MFKRMLSLVLAASLLLGCGISGISFAVDAAPQSGPVEMTVGGGALKVEVYADDIVRVRFAPDGTFRDKGLATFVDPDKKWDKADYTVEESNAEYVITTAKLTVRVNKSTGAVSYFDKTGAAVAAEGKRTAQPVKLDGKTYYQVRQNFVAADTEYLYGLGNVDSMVGNRGRTVSVAQTNTEKRTPMFYSNQGYGVFFDITSNGELGWGDGNGSYYYQGSATDSIDYYFFYGPEADEVISGYRQVTGTASLLPKNNFGYVQSRNRYSAQKELLDDMQRFRDRGVPVDVTVIDYFWWASAFNDITRWSGTWTNVPQMMQQLHDMHITASISVWPAFQSGSETYKTVSKKEGFLLPEDTNFGRVYDPTTEENRSYYWSLINDNIFSKGLDSIWLDACEPEMGSWAKGGIQTAAGNSRVIGLLYPLLTNKGVYEGQRALEGNTKRVNTLSRGMVAGNQRYGTQSWSGDVASTWDQLPKEVRGALNYAASGLTFFSTDTGGYFSMDTSDPKSRELFLRWLQFSTFSSIMRVHGEGCIKNPWSFGAEYEEYILSCINLRERLVPYIYSLAGRVNHEDGTMVRPLVFDYRTDANVWEIDDQYMFGDFFMVCPVTKLGQREREVYLPAGEWIDFWTGTTIESRGERFKVSAPLDEMPVFVKAGAVVPMAMESQYVDQHPDEGEIRVYMGADGRFTLYEDEGDNYNYEKGAYSEIPMSYDDATRTLTIGKRTGSFAGMPESRRFHIVFVQGEYGSGVASSVKYDQTVTYTGDEVKVSFNPDFEAPVPPLKLSTLPKPASAPAAEVPERAMVGEWLFGEGEGAKVRDTSGNFNNGAIKNISTAEWTTGKADNALTFSGGSANKPGTYVDVADSDTLDVSTGVSFSAWVNFKGNGHGNIVNKGGNGSSNPGFSFIILNGNLLQVEVQTADGAKTTAQAAQGNFPKNGWHHVAFTWQSKDAGGDGIIRIYVDGKQVSDDKNTSNFLQGPIGVNELPLRFGCSADNEPAWPNYFKGTMDEVRLYNYALAAGDIASLAKMETVGVPNPSDITIDVKDRALTVHWTTPDVADVETVRVTVYPEGGKNPTIYDVKPDGSYLNVDNLQNGTYYHVSLQTILKDGSKSQGAYLVSGVNDYPTAISCLVTHDQAAYGYITNYTGSEITGTLIAEVYDMTRGGVSVLTEIQENVIVGALDSQRIQIGTDAFKPNEVIVVYFVKDGEMLALPVCVLREQRYVRSGKVDIAREALRAACETVIDETRFTEESVTAYKAVLADAKTLLADESATIEHLTAALNALNSTLVMRQNARETTYVVLLSLLERTIDESKYTAESLAAYQGAVGYAWDVYRNADSTLEQLNAAIEQLKTTLVERSPEEAIAEARAELKALTERAIIESRYTAESVAAYKAALAEAQALVDNADATLEQLNAAIEKLKTTLVEKAPETIVYGDVNGDGAVDTADAVLVLQRAAKLIGDGDLNVKAADVNGDGTIDTADAVLILQKAAKLIEKFPVEG